MDSYLHILVMSLLVGRYSLCFRIQSFHFCLILFGQTWRQVFKHYSVEFKYVHCTFGALSFPFDASFLSRLTPSSTLRSIKDSQLIKH